MDAVIAAADAAMTAAYGRADHTRLAHAAFCLAGMDWVSDHEFWRAQLDDRYPGLSATLHNDGFALLRAGEPDGLGVALSVGTGGAVVARGPERRVDGLVLACGIRSVVGLGGQAFTRSSAPTSASIRPPA